MPTRFAFLSKGIPLPPSGWALAILLLLYILTGLIGHDPWKHDDAISIGVAFSMVEEGKWLFPHLAGEPYPSPPLYFLIAAVFGKLFSWALPFHDAARLASAFCAVFALQFILLAARELYGKTLYAVAPLTLAGSIGFLFHAHEAQPMLATLALHAMSYWGLCLLPRQPRLAATALGIALGLGFLASGFLALITLLPLWLITLWRSKRRLSDLSYFGAALILGAAVALCWLLPLYAYEAPLFHLFFENAALPWLPKARVLQNLANYLGLFSWYAWPALPLAVSALWAKRRTLSENTILLPLLWALVILGLLTFTTPAKSSSALLILPPLVLLSVAGVMTLRRGAASALDWFGVMGFTLFAILAWVGGAALMLGVPDKLARQALRLEPGFIIEPHFIALSFSALISLVWIWLVITSPRSPMRGVMNWMYGLTLFWSLIALLWMPWIDYGKSYRTMSQHLARELPKNNTCTANANLPPSLRAIFYYFNGMKTIPQNAPESKECAFLILQGLPRDPDILKDAGWKEIWAGNRPSDRHPQEHLRLYRRNARGKTPDKLGDIVEEDPSAL